MVWERPTATPNEDMHDITMQTHHPRTSERADSLVDLSKFARPDLKRNARYVTYVAFTLNVCAASDMRARIYSFRSRRVGDKLGIMDQHLALLSGTAGKSCIMKKIKYYVRNTGFLMLYWPCITVIEEREAQR